VKLIDGRAIAAGISQETAAAAAALRTAGTLPRLAIVVPTRDEATMWYVRSITRAAAKAGIECQLCQLDEPSRGQLMDVLGELSADSGVHGIICQTPLPNGLSLSEIGLAIDVAKDIDGASPASMGRLVSGLPTYAPATAAAVLEIARREGPPLDGARVVVVGRSVVVGKPAALLLLAQNATVTICHSRTVGLAEVCSGADILVAAVGRPGMLGADHVKPGATVIDVGTNTTADGGLTGDVDAVEVARQAAKLTPVPGGVGPVTTALLLRNVVTAAQAAVIAKTGADPSPAGPSAQPKQLGVKVVRPG
jgi:methylenetetrahydrofolate dehydrogenase (NADP+)/methenyltetrahydrofolate cyclohydrolase